MVKGFGNNGKDGLEGVRRDNLIGTYLHGPLLPKNAWLADHLIALALERRYGRRPDLEPLDDALERAAHESARNAGLRSRIARSGYSREMRALTAIPTLALLLLALVAQPRSRRHGRADLRRRSRQIR